MNVPGLLINLLKNRNVMETSTNSQIYPKKLGSVLELRKTNAQLIENNAYLKEQNKALELLISKYLKKNLTAYNYDNVDTAACEFFDITMEELFSSSRKREIVSARHSCMYVIKMNTSQTLKAIGLHYSGRDHSTVINACEAIEKYMDARDRISEAFMLLFLPFELFLQELDNFLKKNIELNSKL